MAEVRYIRGLELDRSRWDGLMISASNVDVFGSSVFLDTMTEGWDAIICGDYDAVLPLPVRRRFGIQYTYILPFCGPFSVYGELPGGISAATMLKAIPRSLRRCDINLWINEPPLGWQAITRFNHRLDLSTDYPAIRSRYQSTCRNILNRGLAFGLQILSGIPVSLQLQMAQKFGGLGRTDRLDVLRFETLCQRWSHVSEVLSLVISSTDGRVISGAVFLRSAHQLHYLLGWSSPEGKQHNASRHMLDHVIRMHASQPLILDFEGSDIPGVAQFFESFGAVPHPYHLLRRDNIPVLLRRVISFKNQLFGIRNRFDFT
jgi:hypothetical protein